MEIVFIFGGLSIFVFFILVASKISEHRENQTQDLARRANLTYRPGNFFHESTIEGLYRGNYLKLET
jgi:hypothetical protein